jgi:hypothetical protein
VAVQVAWGSGALFTGCQRESAPVYTFLGFRIWPAQIRLDGARARRFRRRFRRLEADLAAGRIDADGRERSAQSLVGWAAQADTAAFRRSFFDQLEA